MRVKHNNLTFGEVIKINRKRVGLSQSDLARIAGVHMSTISRWENDDSVDEMQIHQFNKIATAIKLPVPKIFKSKGKVIKRLRNKLNFSPEHFAFSVGVSLSTIVRWEREDAFEKIALKHFKKIAKITSVEMPEFLIDSPEAKYAS